MDGGTSTPNRVDDVARAAVTALQGVLGARRIGFALSEGGGRRLRFTASDRDNSRSVDWCHIDAYDDVPLTTVLQTGEPVFAAVDELEPRYGGFAAQQRRQHTAAVAAVPLPAEGTRRGAVIAYYDSAQPFDPAQRAQLCDAAARLAADLRAAEGDVASDVPTLAAEPVPEGSFVADLLVHGEPSEVAVVRRWAQESLTGWGVDADRIDDAVLCLSELVTNAVIHTQSTCETRLLLDGDALTGIVRDRGNAASLVEEEPPADPLQVHGRGLQVVDALASRWGAEPAELGMTVWFVLDPSPVGSATTR